jgi:hypothetical protein
MSAQGCEAPEGQNRMQFQTISHVCHEPWRSSPT